MKAYIGMAAVWLIAAGLQSSASGQAPTSPSPSSSPAQRMVLVELFTSQGCDMCPEAERLLGVLATKSARAVPIAFHVDYFNDPWVDPFSSKLNSDRQATYNAVYTKPKDPNYGLYYTPMVMVDGVQSVNGRDGAAILAAVRQAQARKPEVALTGQLVPGGNHYTADLRVTVASRSRRVEGRQLLVCAVLRDDLIATRIQSGENAHKTLTARFPARSTQFEFTRLDGGKEVSLTFPFRVEPAWSLENLGVVVFVQDRETAEVYQSLYTPWVPVPNGAGTKVGREIGRR